MADEVSRAVLLSADEAYLSGVEPAASYDTDLGDAEYAGEDGEGDPGNDVEDEVPLEHGGGVPRGAHTRWHRLLFGFGSFGTGMANVIQVLFLMTFLLEVAEVDPYHAGVLLAIKQVYDALTDPVVGRWSDLTVTRWGRRKPFIFGAVVPVSVTWVLMWTSNGWLDDYSIAKDAYYLAIILLYSTANTCLAVPKFALIPEIATTYKMRLSVVTWIQIFTMLGGALASFSWARLIRLFPIEDTTPQQYDYSKGFFIAAICTTPLLLLAAPLGVLLVKEATPQQRREAAPKAHKSEEHEAAALLGGSEEVGQKNDGGGMTWGQAAAAPFLWLWELLVSALQMIKFVPFLLIVLINIVSLLAYYSFANNIYLWMKYVIEEETMTNWVLLMVQGIAMVSFVLWSVIAKLVGKDAALVFGSVLNGIGSLLVFFLEPQEDLWLVFFVLALNAVPGAVGMLLPSSMLPDVIAWQSKETGKQREGIGYSVFLVSSKCSVAIVAALSSFSLGWAGYEKPERVVGGDDEQPSSVITCLRLLVGILPMTLSFIVVLLATFNWWYRERYMKIHF